MQKTLAIEHWNPIDHFNCHDHVIPYLIPHCNLMAAQPGSGRNSLNILLCTAILWQPSQEMAVTPLLSYCALHSDTFT